MPRPDRHGRRRPHRTPRAARRRYPGTRPGGAPRRRLHHRREERVASSRYPVKVAARVTGFERRARCRTCLTVLCAASTPLTVAFTRDFAETVARAAAEWPLAVATLTKAGASLDVRTCEQNHVPIAPGL